MLSAQHYMDHACYGPPSEAVVNAVRDALTQGTSVGNGRDGTSVALEWRDSQERTRQAVAEMLRARAEDITLVESTTQGLGTIAGGLILQPGDNVVFADCEFVGLPAVWQTQRRRGVELRAIPTVGGRIDMRALGRGVDARTRVILLSAVQEVSGCPADLDEVAAIAAIYKSWVIVDGIQEAGVLRCEPASHGVHAYTSGGHKWLGNPFGSGFLWIDPELRSQMEPPFQGYFALREPTGGWARRLNDREARTSGIVEQRHDGASFEVGGTPPWLAAVGLRSAVREKLEMGIDNIERHSVNLADQLRCGLVDLGIDCLTPVGTRSAIVTFSLGEDLNTRFMARAKEAGVMVSQRAVAGVGGIRSSCHVYNTQEDVAALLELASNCR